MARTIASPKAKKKSPKKKKAAPPRYEPGRLIDCEEALSEASAALLALDPETIGRLFEIGGPLPLRRR
jgi:hypothetical protein